MRAGILLLLARICAHSNNVFDALMLEENRINCLSIQCLRDSYQINKNYCLFNFDLSENLT
jgi:hypothetical protein